ncbi:MAG TPA: hypothetical protein VNT26_21585, partial [Candidatus Sulfotelmatobacter sp.]|nr:hypothetical protein [Candidatus Sulfotelmatobacter sp.]
MNKTTLRNSILLSSLLGVMVAGQAMGATYRYRGSGDYMLPNWTKDGVVTDTLPGTADTIRCNYGSNTVTLTAEAIVQNFQLGVDESGQLVVDSGGKLITVGPANSTVGNNANPNVIGRLAVKTGGEVSVTNVLFVGAKATGILTVDGGKVSVVSHLWCGSTDANGVGFIYLTNGGILNVGGNIGLGTVNASSASGGKCSLYVQEGGVLNLNQISPVNSIQAGSVLDLSGSGVVIVPNDITATMSAYTNVGRITAYGGLGTVGIDYNNTNAGKTTLFAIAPAAPPPTEVVWAPAANPLSTGKWNEKANWTGSVVPAAVTKVIFNVAGAIPCTVTNLAVASHVVMGDNGPGGTLIITNGGSLTLGSDNASVIGYNSNAVMIIEDGGMVSFGQELSIGYNWDAAGTLIMNGGTASVAGNFDLG